MLVLVMLVTLSGLSIPAVAQPVPAVPDEIEVDLDGARPPPSDSGTTITVGYGRSRGRQSVILRFQGETSRRLANLALDVPTVEGAVAVGGGESADERAVTPGSSLELILSVTDVSEAIETDGFLEATLDDVPIVLVRVRVLKRPDLALDSDAYAVTTPESATVVLVTVTNTTEVAAQGVRISLGPLLGPGGSQARIDPSDAVFDLDGGETEATLFPVMLPVVGEYQGVARLMAGSALADAAPVTVTRSSDDLPIVVATAGPFRGTDGGRTASVRVELTVTETDGSARHVSTGVRVRAVDDASPADLTDVYLAEVCTKAEDHAPIATTTLQARVPSTISAHLCGLPGPGRYTAAFALSDGSRPPFFIDADVTVRHPSWYALLTLAVGVLMALFLSLWPSLLTGVAQRRRLDWVRRRLDAARATGPGIGDAVKVLTEREASIRDQEKWNDVDALVDQTRLVGPYLQLTEMARTAGLDHPPELDPLRTMIFDDSPDEEQRATVLGSIDATAQHLRDRISILSDLRALQGAVEDWEDAGAPDETVAEVRTATAVVRKKLEAKQYKEASDAAHDARRALAVKLAARLRASINEPPEAVRETLLGTPEWSRAQTRIERQATKLADQDPARLIDAYVHAACDLLNVMANQLERDIRDAEAAMDSTPAEDRNGAWSQRRGDLLRAAQLARRAAEHARAGDQRLATVTFQSAATMKRDPGAVALESVTAEAVLPSLRAAKAGPPTSAVAQTVEAGPALRAPWYLTTAEILLAILLAVVVGYETQYAGNLTWGHGSDYVAAILWGVALSGSTHAGFVAIRDALRPGGAP